MSKDREQKVPRSRDYEAPKIRDLEELGLSGKSIHTDRPLGVNTCSVGTGDNNTCVSGTGTDNDCDVGPT